MHHALYNSPVGPLRIVADDVALKQLWLPNEVESRSPGEDWIEDASHPIIASVIRILAEYFAGKRVDFNVIPCEPEGSEFQRAVWRKLRDIGYADVVNYGAIAAGVGRPRGAQAVGGAVGSNPIAIVLPCHRVLGKDGALTGYSGGLGVKKALLALEGIPYKERS